MGGGGAEGLGGEGAEVGVKVPRERVPACVTAERLLYYVLRELVISWPEMVL